ncbi:Immunity protein 27 [Bradyrhizobium sp. NFR13]|uniref:Imm27 family immunity protein n=1 Tax=Bradyrhizobium sp. NFR13 TaxID=1566285 RepID=UPI0008F3DBDE|nr:Imm27 family immunity protein [Bradyrhizobium sp. NFR13]SFM17144.1 Immunity protein 27 [Bradyrhizobium sp. NFR13]
MTEAEISAALAKLEEIGHDASGWDTLFRDPVSGALWEITYPHSEMHGGGPRQLDEIAPSDAEAKYPELFELGH